jgi:hypothetical protein
MTYLIAAYGITLVALLSYGTALSRERARLQAQKGDSRPDSDSR